MEKPQNGSRRSLRDGMSLDDLRGWAETMMKAYGADSGEDEETKDETKMNDLLRAARDGHTRISKVKWTDRLRENDPELTRLDLSASLIKELSDFQKEDFLHALPFNDSVRIVHLSGMQLHDHLTEEQITSMVESVGKLKNLEELFVFRGGSRLLNEDVISKVISEATNLKVLMIWGYGRLGRFPDLAGALRNHESLERITITLPKNTPYAELDIYGMALASMQNLHCLNIRGSGKQPEPVLSPEATSILLSSKSIESLYLENLGLIDDHTDAICHELKSNHSLGLLDIKDNYFTDDALFTFAQTLPENQTLQSLDLSGVQITERGGQAMAKGLSANTTLTHLEIEGTADKYADEFDVKPGNENTEWYKAIDYQLRLNRAGTTGNRKKFVEALNSVSDHLGCLYTFVRQSPQYCDRNPSTQVSGSKLIL